MTDEVDHTAGYLRVMIEKVRIFDRTLGNHRKNSVARKEMNEAANEAEAFLNDPPGGDNPAA